MTTEVRRVVRSLLAFLLGCSRVPLSGTDTDTGDGVGSSGGSSTSSSSSGGGGSSGGDGSSSGESSTSSSSSSSGGGDGGTSGSYDTSGGQDTWDQPFLPAPDHGPDGDWCDTFVQDCPPGEKCTIWANDGGSSWNATRCVPIDLDPKAVGEPCTAEGSGVSGIDNCDVGAMCWDVDPDSLEGYCLAFCAGSASHPSCANPQEICYLTGNGFPALCFPTCDPLAQDCREGDTCVMVGSGEAFICGPDASGEEGQYGDPCEFVNGCDPGLFCANAASVPDCTGTIGCCTEFCDLRLPDPGSVCSARDQGAECVSFFEPGQVPFGYAHVGGCMVP